LLRFVARELSPDAALVVAGDFNDTEPFVARALGDSGLTALTGQGLATFPSRLPLMQLDHVFARGMKPLSLRVPDGRIWSRMSDHLPLIAEFDVSVENV